MSSSILKACDFCGLVSRRKNGRSVSSMCRNTGYLGLDLLNDQSYYRWRRCVPMPQDRSRKPSEVDLASLILTLLSRRPRRFSGITAIIRLRLMTFARQPAFCEEVCIAHLVTREGY